MIKNNKGVTLVELLIVIVVMGIIAAFAIPAVGTIIENTNRDAVLADAIAVENAAKLYCAQTTCSGTGQTLTWTEIDPYVDGLSVADYLSGTVPATVIATKTDTGWAVVLEAGTAAAAEGAWEFTDGEATAVTNEAIGEAVSGDIPSLSSRDDVTTD